jgi:hypothetical protein
MTTLRKRFLTNTDETGRFIVKSIKTGKTYFVEPIDNRPDHQIWGDIDPASKTLQGTYGSKYRGSVKDNESMISNLNGFDNIQLISGSPFAEIQRREQLFLEKTRET